MVRKKKPEEAPLGSPLWMSTFSDLMTQILCFFVMLSASASYDMEKANIMVSSMNTAFGTFNKFLDIKRWSPNIQPAYRTDAKIPGWESAFSSDMEYRNIEKTLHDITAYIEAEKQTDSVKMNLGKDRVTFSLTNKLLFQAGSAELKKEAFPVLYEIAIALRKISNPILIVGHSDPSLSTSGKYPTNWELSTARAMTVARFFMTKGKIDEARFRVSGRAHYQPVTSNVTEEGRQLNRRVDIIVLAKGPYDD